MYIIIIYIYNNYIITIMEGQGDFVVGARVRVQGLVGAAEHNGKVGVITEKLQNERVGVTLDNGKGIKVKLVNLVMVPVSISDFITLAMVAQVARAPRQLVDLPNRQISNLDGVQRLVGLHELLVNNNNIVSLAGVEFPASLQELHLYGNEIADLNGAVFPRNLKYLNLNGNQITSLAGVAFPDGLKQLHLDRNRIDSLSNVKLPKGLQVFSLLDNEIIKDCAHFKIPPGLLDIKISHASTNCPSLSRRIVDFRNDIMRSFEGNPQARVDFRTKLQAASPGMFPEGQEGQEGLAEAMLERLQISASASRKCSSCGKEETTGIKFKKCGGCRTLYCSQECQTTDWPFHRLVCKQQEEKGKAAAAPEAEGGNKSKTRRRRRQSKRNKMQPKTKYKYSRRRRPAKSRKYSKRL